MSASGAVCCDHICSIERCRALHSSTSVPLAHRGRRETQVDWTLPAPILVSLRDADRPLPPCALHIHAALHNTQPSQQASFSPVNTFHIRPLLLISQPDSLSPNPLAVMTRTLAPQDVDPSGAPQPPSQQSKPPKPSYTQLSGEAARAEVVFRVHSMMSASPLHWTGRAETSGFCSPNPHLGLLTPGAYAAALEPLPTPSPPTPTPTQSGPAPPSPPPVLVALDDDMNGLPSTQPSDPKSVAAPPGQNVEVYGVPWLGFERDPSIRQSLVDHCTRRTRPSHNWDWSGPDMAADDYSSWVSCTASLRWAVWEVAQRLVHGEQQVDIAVIGVVPEKDEEELRGKRPAFQRVKAGATGEVTLAPLNTLRDHQKYGRGTGDRARMTNSEKEAVANAIYMAHTSEEVLFYGRIFTGSVKANLTFTREVSTKSERRHEMHEVRTSLERGEGESGG